MAMAIAEHSPGKLYGRNQGLLRMSHKQLHDFASTKRKGLPLRVPPRRKRFAEHLTKMRMSGAFGKY